VMGSTTRREAGRSTIADSGQVDHRPPSKSVEAAKGPRDVIVHYHDAIARRPSRIGPEGRGPRELPGGTKTTSSLVWSTRMAFRQQSRQLRSS